MLCFSNVGFRRFLCRTGEVGPTKDNDKQQMTDNKKCCKLCVVSCGQIGKKLYVGSLPYDTTDESLKEAFSRAGNVVSASVITDKMSGRSRGFGFVEMESDEEAQKEMRR